MKKHKKLLIVSAVIFIVLAIALIPKAYIKLNAKGYIIWEHVADPYDYSATATLISLKDYSTKELSLDGYDFVYNIRDYKAGAYICTARANAIIIS